MKPSRCILCVLAVSLFVVLACSENPSKSMQASSQKESAVTAQKEGAASQQSAQEMKTPQPPTGAASEVILGTLSLTEGQLVLSTKSGDYLLEGRDLSSMVGMTVKVTGAVKEKEDRRIIEVTSAEQVQ